jgi:predicted ArsR family transcriptional regulator
MERKDFLKSACTVGICSCTGIAALSGSNLFGNSKRTYASESDWQPGFMRKRFAKLIGNLDSTVDKQQKEKILQGLGKACAEESKEEYNKFKGNIAGFLDEIKKIWADSTEYNKEAGYLRVVGKKQKSCFCPFVDCSITPKDFCNCTVGYNKEVYGVIIEQPVNVEIEESILRGGERCTMLITII